MGELGAGGRQGETDVERIELGVLQQVRAQALGLGGESLLAFGRKWPGNRLEPRGARIPAAALPGETRWRLLCRRLLEDQVGVGAADAEGGDRGAARAAA